MSRASRRAASAALFIRLANALALSDFSPALTGVPDPCDSVYMQDIPACSRSDFSGSAGCSESCILGLVAIDQAIQLACQGFSAPNGSLISFFQQGQGAQLLCRVAVVTASATSSSPVPLTGQGTMVLPSTSNAGPSSILVDTSSAPLPAAATSITTATNTTSSSAPTSVLTASGSPTVQTTLSTSATQSPPITSSSPSRSSQPTSTTSTVTQTSAAAATQSDTDGNGGTGGDPFAPSAAAISSPDWFLLLLGTLSAAWRLS